MEFKGAIPFLIGLGRVVVFRDSSPRFFTQICDNFIGECFSYKFETKMEKEILKIASVMLKNYGEELSNHSCNDTEKEILDIINKELGIDNFRKLINDNGHDASPEDGLETYDWIVADVISKQLDKMSK